MDLDALRMFIAVIDTGSVRAASDRLGVPRSTIRRRLGELDAMTGSALTQTSRRGVSPTPAGRLLADRGRVLLEVAAEIVEAVRGEGSAMGEMLRLNVPVGLAPELLVRTSRLFHGLWPTMALSLTPSTDPIGALVDGADLAISLRLRVPDGPWNVRTLAEVPEGLVASNRYLAAHPPVRTPDDLARHPLFVWQPPDGDPYLLPGLDGRSHPVRPRQVSTDIHLLRGLAIGGAGIAFVPDARIADPDGRESSLVPVLEGQIGRVRPVHIAWPAAAERQVRVRQVLDAVEALVAAEVNARGAS